MNLPPAIAARLKALKPMAKGGWKCCCPCHDDKRPSAMVRVTDSGNVLFTCMVCKCRYNRAAFFKLLCEATGTSPWDWAAEHKRPKYTTQRRSKRPMARKVIRTFPYIDQHGELIMEVCRFDTGEPKCMPRRPARDTDDGKDVFTDKDGAAWVWSGPLAGDDPFDVLYNLPDLLTRPDDPVCICEGEPDCDTLAALGFVAVTNPFGAGHWSEHFAKWCAGRRCVIFEDNDPAGRHRTPYVAGTLVVAGAASIRVVRFTDLPEKSDVTDWLNLPAYQLFGDDAKFAEVCQRVQAAQLWVQEGRVAA